MKLDLAKLPVLEAIIAFLLIMTVVTFAAAFAATEDNSGGEAVAESPTPGPSPSPGVSPSPGGPIVLAMRDSPNSFDPNEITVQAGSTATFELTNEGNAFHNMHIAGEVGDYTEDFCDGSADPCSTPNQVRGGETATLTWDVPQEPGEVDFRCDFHPREMTGTITVE